MQSVPVSLLAWLLMGLRNHPGWGPVYMCSELCANNITRHNLFPDTFFVCLLSFFFISNVYTHLHVNDINYISCVFKFYISYKNATFVLFIKSENELSNQKHFYLDCQFQFYFERRNSIGTFI